MQSVAPTVSLVRCASYGSPLRPALDAVLGPLGGLSAFVHPGQTVLLKPNLLTDRTPEQAVTTHPEVVRHLIRAVRELGATPIVGDSPASAVKVATVLEKTGMRAVCDEERATLVSLEQAGSDIVESGPYRFTIARAVREADVVVNLPKVKTHVLTTLTAAVKNMYGVVPGYQKAHLHCKHPSPADFGGLITAIIRSVPPVLNIADGIVGMEGDGPSAGRPIALGFLAASSDAFALDRTLCAILGIPPRSVPYLRGLAHTPLPAVVGCLIDTIRPASFALPSTLRSRLTPAWLVKRLRPFLWFRPTIGPACVFCGQCVRACPAQALTQVVGRPPELLTQRCIGCCCCHEVCPVSAIRMTQSRLFNLIRRGAMP